MKKEKKEYRINLYFNNKEQDKLILKFGGFPTGNIIKRLIFNQKITVRYYDENTQVLVSEINKIGNNLNQITRLFNQNKNKINKENIQLIEENIHELKQILIVLRKEKNIKNEMEVGSDTSAASINKNLMNEN